MGLCPPRTICEQEDSNLQNSQVRNIMTYLILSDLISGQDNVTRRRKHYQLHESG